MRRCAGITICLVALLAGPRIAAAQVTELPPTVVETDPPTSVALTTGIASVVDTDIGGGTAPSLADIVSTLPGVQVREAGGPGSFAAVSLRGVGPENVAVVLDDLPLSTATLGPVDLSLYPPESLKAVEVWRGTGPIRFASPLGGVLRLVTHTPTDRTELSAHASYGSFGTRGAHLFAAGPAGDIRYVAYVGYQGSRGDFVFYDDRNTPYNANDNGLSRRRNNGFDAITTRLKGETDGPGNGTLRFLVGGSFRAQGVPGPLAAAPALDASAAQTEAMSRVSLVDASLFGGLVRLGLGTDYLFSARQFRDPLQKVGLHIAGAASRLDQLGADARAEILETSANETELAPRLQWDRFRQMAGVGSGALDEVSLDRGRLTLGVGIEHRLDVLANLRLVPSVRVDAVRDTGPQISRRVLDEWSPRLGALWTVSVCELRANAGRFHRFPSLLERYGDLVTSVASPDLAPERGFMADMGVRCRVEPPLVKKLHVEANGFAHDGRDLIVVTQNSQRWLHAENAGHVRTWGLETSATAEHALVAVTLSYTLTMARELAASAWLDGKQVPGIARHRLDASARLGPEWLTACYEVTVASLTYLDLANLTPIPQRVLHNISLTYKHAASGLEATLWIRNLLNHRSEKVPLPDGSAATMGLADFLGYPIPGRSIFAGLAWRTP